MRKNVNILMCLKVVGWLLIIESVFMIFPMGVALYDGHSTFSDFLISAGITAASGCLLTFGLRPASTNMAKREGFLLTAMVWVIFSAFGMLPFVLGDSAYSITDGYFEAMSGFTTTGASVFSSVEHLGRPLLLWRCIMQWLGGMGIILFTLAVLPMLNHSGGMQMFNAEVTGITREKIRPRVSQTALGLWGVYFALTLMLAILLWLGPMNIFDSVCHAMSTVSTGGFSTTDAGIESWSSVYVECVLTLFMFFGGVNFALLFKAAHGDFRPLASNSTFRAYVRIILLCFAGFAVAAWFSPFASSIADYTIRPLFIVVSTITSTGLAPSYLTVAPPFVIASLFVLMMFGACAGSTSGGAKIDRLLILSKNTRNEIYRSLHPNAILSVRINGKAVASDTVAKVIAFLCLYVIIIGAGGIVLAALGVPVIDAFFSSFSCVSNTGFGADITGVGATYASIPTLGKWVLASLMMIGRLEIFTVLIIFTPGFWQR